MKAFYRYLLLLALVLVPAGMIAAQEDGLTSEAPLPTSYRQTGFRYEAQGWNNCGPATITNALTYFGYTDNQRRAADWLKPHYEDKNVNPVEMVSYVNTQVPELPVQALVRFGRNLDTLKTLIANNFPVIIEAGYDPDPADMGWMGHYLLVVAYDDTTQEFITLDSYAGENYVYSYDHINLFWRHFNRTYIVLYETQREAELMALLGDDADVEKNALAALEIARHEATYDPTDGFAWFNIGTSYVQLADTYGQQAYEYAATAYDEARKHGLPWRMMWYQFGAFEAYNAVGRYDDMLTLAGSNLNDGGGKWVEETFYYGGIAREALGETERALQNYRQAVFLNGNFTAAQEAITRLEGGS